MSCQPITRAALVAAGSNLPIGDKAPKENLEAGRQRLAALGWQAIRTSRFYHTPAWPPGTAAPDFVNAVFAFELRGEPEDLLRALHAVEAEAGRERRERWAPRTLDLDLLAWGDTIRPDEETFRRWASLDLGDQGRRTPERLILPHPRLHERTFVLVPLAEVAPGWRHPVLGRTAAELAGALPQADVDAMRIA